MALSPVERQIVSSLIGYAAHEGFTLEYIWDGEENHFCVDEGTAACISVLDNLDSASLVFVKTDIWNERVIDAAQHHEIGRAHV